MALLVLASGLTFGWSLWPDWLGSLPAHAAFIDTAVSNFRKPSVMAGFELFGLAPAWARAAQYGVGLGVVGVVWSCMARGPIPMAVAAMLVGTFAGSPYTFVYDMPVVSNAALLLAVMPARGVWRWVDLALVAAALSFPAVMILTTRFTWVAGPVLVLLFARLAWRALRSVSDPASPAPRL